MATVVACFAFSKSQAQQVNGIRLTEINTPYIEIYEDVIWFSDKVGIRLNYGQLMESRENSLIKDDNGKKLEFNSLLDCVNKMKSYGYELFQAREIQSGKDNSYTKYTLKKI